MLATQVTSPKAEEQVLPWQWLADQVDMATYHPIADPEVIAERVSENDYIYYVLKNPVVGAYLKLDEADYNLWQLMDGSRTVKDLVVAHFVHYKTFAYGRIAALVNELKDEHFLLDKPVSIFKQATQQLEAEDWRYRWQSLARAFIEHRVPVRGLDRYITAIYRWGGRIFFNPVLQIVMLIIALAGLFPFAYLLRMPALFPVFSVRDGGYLAGLVLLVIANMVVIFIHELAHALTTKHYGREVPAGGVMIYYGMPAFYVNTMDIWLEPKKHRIAVSWAGPFSGIVVGGICSFLALFLAVSQPILSQLCFKMAFVGYIGSLVNMNPLLELDGYFILMDALDIPMLRQRALSFIKTELPGKLKALLIPAEKGEENSTRAVFTREELIFTIFGVLSALYAIYIIWFTLFLWNERFVGLLVDLWTNSGWFGKLVVVVLGLAVFIPAGLALGATAWRWAAGGFEWLQKRGFFEQEQNIALLAILGLVLLLGLPRLFNAQETLFLPIWLVILAAVAVWSLLMTSRQYVGSEVQLKFWGLVVSAGLLFGATLALALLGSELTLILTQLAIFPLAIVSLSGMISADLRYSSQTEKWLMSILILSGFGGTIFIVRRVTSDLESFLVGGALFALALFGAAIIPSLVAYANTRFIIPWVLLTIGGVALGCFNMLAFFSSPDQWQWLLLVVVSFWAVGGFVYASAGWRIRFPGHAWEQGFTLSEEQRLRHAFSRFFETLFEGFRIVFGDRRARSVDDDLDVIAVTANWGVELDRGRIRDRLDLKKMTILEQANRYQEVLGRAIDLMDNWAGSRFIARAAQAAYDSLPWPERETLGRYVLAGTTWGATIAHQFASVRGEHFHLLRSLPIFAGCSNEVLDQILAVARRETIPTGVVLVKEGKPYPHFALVMGGEVEAWKINPSTGHSVLVGELKRGSAFGSQVFAPNGGAVARATYRTSVLTDILFIDGIPASELVKRGTTLNTKAPHISVVGQMLIEMPLFAELSPQQIETLLQKMSHLSVPKGQVIIRQGGAGQYFYIIKAGEVGVMVSADGGSEKMVAKLGQGEHFGETSLYTDQPHSATCVALTDVRLLTLDEFTFDRLVATSHQMTHYVEQVSSGRLKDTRKKLGLR